MTTATLAAPHYVDDLVTLYHGDCIDVMAQLPDNSVDSIVTDPPYGLGFMGKAWDALPPGRPWAEQCLRVLKPGGHLIAFGGTRTWHRLAVAVEDAGFEIRDSIAWLYGSGFPKSLDISKAIDKNVRGNAVRLKLLHFANIRGIDGKWLESHGVASASSFTDWTIGGHVPSDRNWDLIKAALEISVDEERAFERKVLHERQTANRQGDGTVVGLGHSGNANITAPATDAAKKWEGWGTALKPAFEPAVVGRKPLAGTVAANVQAHGVGGLNIDACRIGDETRTNPAGSASSLQRELASRGSRAQHGKPSVGEAATVSGRWPTNVVLDDDQAAALDLQSGTLSSGANPTRRGSDKFRTAYGDFAGQTDITPARGADSGGASRFFPTFRYEAKAPASERPVVDGTAHATVKPLALMQWLCRLVTPPGGLILEPFAGSGTTVEAAIRENFSCIAIEREAAYLPLIEARLNRPFTMAFDLGAL